MSRSLVAPVSVISISNSVAEQVDTGHKATLTVVTICYCYALIRDGEVRGMSFDFRTLVVGSRDDCCESVQRPQDYTNPGAEPVSADSIMESRTRSGQSAKSDCTRIVGDDLLIQIRDGDDVATASGEEGWSGRDTEGKNLPSESLSPSV